MSSRSSHTKWLGNWYGVFFYCAYCGFGQLGSGKIMGLASYGKEDPNKTFCF